MANSGFGPTVDDGLGGAVGTGDGDGFALEVDVFEIRAGGDEDGVAVVRSVDAGLDGGLVRGNVDGRCASAVLQARTKSAARRAAKRRNVVAGMRGLGLLWIGFVDGTECGHIGAMTKLCSQLGYPDTPVGALL